MLEAIFQDLNGKHFGSQLPLPKLSWNPRLSSTAGRFCPGSRQLIRPRPPQIEVATYLRDLPDGEMHVRDTVLHEMIHYFLWHERRPHGHTAEFHEIMKRVGAKRWNTVPKERPFKHWYQCPHCREGFPTRRRLGVSACARCCKRYNGGDFHERFRLMRMATPPAPAPNVVRATSSPPAAPAAAAEEPRLSVSEVIRRLEDLKSLIRTRTS